MAKESSLQTFAITGFVKEVYCIVKVLHKYNGSHRNNSVLKHFYQSLMENIVFTKLLVTSFSNGTCFTEFWLKDTDTFRST